MCKHEQFIKSLGQPQSNREYWIMTEIFVYLHGGKDYCDCQKTAHNSDYAKSKSCANCRKLYQCNDVRKHPEWHCEKSVYLSALNVIEVYKLVTPEKERSCLGFESFTKQRLNQRS